ncbi:helix-turn-helix domain-containing protein [Actinomadura sp. 9N407]|uniref:helix-turn-helix domain-containing protein n=1 Tax=Actinomadura sp. 9N407 TaxID=3375154 RepID=UPI0037B433F8
MPDSPTVHQRRLRIELRAAREAAGLTQEQAAKAQEWSLSKIIRIEAGTVRVTVTDVKVLLQLYGVPEERVGDVLKLARAAREQGWWNRYRRVLGQQMLDFIGYESAAKVIHEFQPLILPGLLQTRAYAHEIISRLREQASGEEVNDLVDVRMRRQEIFDREDPLEFFFLIDESVVRRLVGGTAVMRAQLAHLLEMAKRPNVTIEIVPLNAGAHGGLVGQFKLLEFGDVQDDPVLYLEGAQGDVVGRDYREEIALYRERFETLRGISLGPVGSAVLLSNLAETL